VEIHTDIVTNYEYVSEKFNVKEQYDLETRSMALKITSFHKTYTVK